MNPSENCEIILRSVKNSNLHYILKENPFSVQVTIRKKYVDTQRQPCQKLMDGNEATKRNFEQEMENLKKDLETKTIEAKQFDETNQKLTVELKDVSEELYNTKIELTKQTEQIKDSLEEKKKLKTVIQNLKPEKKIVMKLSEEKFEGLQDELSCKNREIEQLMVNRSHQRGLSSQF